MRGLLPRPVPCTALITQRQVLYCTVLFKCRQNVLLCNTALYCTAFKCRQNVVLCILLLCCSPLLCSDGDQSGGLEPPDRERVTVYELHSEAQTETRPAPPALLLFCVVLRWRSIWSPRATGQGACGMCASWTRGTSPSTDTGARCEQKKQSVATPVPLHLCHYVTLSPVWHMSIPDFGRFSEYRVQVHGEGRGGRQLAGAATVT